jgi:hypothetical protein
MDAELDAIFESTIPLINRLGLAMCKMAHACHGHFAWQRLFCGGI